MGKVHRNIKILVTGASGFLGSHMMHFLGEKGYSVFTSMGDLRSYNTALQETKGMDWVFHFAADMGGIGYFSKENYRPPINNLTIDLNVLRACEQNGIKRLFYPSSACAYPLGKMNQGVPLFEEMLDLPAVPDQMYGWEKLTMTKLLRGSKIARVGILHTIYGEGQEYEGRKAKFPPQMAYKVLRAKKTGKLEVWGDGRQTRTFLYVSDAIEKIYEVMSRPYHGEVNIGSDLECSIMDVVGICSKILNINKIDIEFNSNKPTGPTRRRCDNTKFNTHYKYRDKVSLEQGFERLINYIQSYER